MYKNNFQRIPTIYLSSTPCKNYKTISGFRPQDKMNVFSFECTEAPRTSVWLKVHVFGQIKHALKFKELDTSEWLVDTDMHPEWPPFSGLESVSVYFFILQRMNPPKFSCMNLYSAFQVPLTQNHLKPKNNFRNTTKLKVFMLKLCYSLKLWGVGEGGGTWQSY